METKYYLGDSTIMSENEKVVNIYTIGNDVVHYLYKADKVDVERIKEQYGVIDTNEISEKLYRELTVKWLRAKTHKEEELLDEMDFRDTILKLEER